MTGRKFSSAAEDPASALRAALLERKYVRNNDYISTVEDVLSRQDAQEDAAYQISVEAMEMSKKYGFEALKDVYKRQGQDYPLISACTLIITIMVLLANLLLEIVYGLIDPRIKTAQQD